ncbi:terminase [Aggregatibacter actinomycetemcomitans]|uniref:terminase n=1 Tax=Aggregatibacter actinomycetemcomitans TaxID=714 RepID=UPI00197C99A3|nr:terminase [Aggregatibacter actinomycetemcomitans]MBN6063237.1 terminase [Aggregatibacter actinomycetemcomitans]MBN6083111.1 terminase [Aggregatibacter actinomycetemcomitans]
MGYGWEIRRQFAKAYARHGNATHALKMVLGEERAGKMQPHTLRAKASELLNDYRTVELIEREKAEMQQRGEPLPHYRGRTERTDLITGEPIEIKLPPARPFVIPWGMKGLLKQMEQLKRSTCKS